MPAVAIGLVEVMGCGWRWWPVRERVLATLQTLQRACRPSGSGLLPCSAPAIRGLQALDFEGLVKPLMAFERCHNLGWGGLWSQKLSKCLVDA